MNPDFWRGRRVLLTGHTGFKGSWLALWLTSLGAKVTGFSNPATEPSMFNVCAPWDALDRSIEGDVTDADAVREAVTTANPELVFHLAAQAFVRRSYRQPIATFETNVMGTAQLLDACRDIESLAAVLVVTSDKVYRQEPFATFNEGDPLGGHDPYSASKAAQEMVSQSYANSFFEARTRVVTCRSGNVIGGGDWGEDRLIPDLMRSIAAGTTLVLRYPDAIRPWQHVLDPLRGYLRYAESVAQGEPVPSALNFGPRGRPVSVRNLVESFIAAYGDGSYDVDPIAGEWEEALTLSLDSGAAEKTLDWRPELSIEQAVALTVEWYRANEDAADMRTVSMRQLNAYLESVDG